MAAIAAAAWAIGPARANPIPAENLRPPTVQWLAEEAQPPQIEGYSSVDSVAPGGTVAFHVSTAPAASFRIFVYRLGWYDGAGGTLLTCLPSCDGHYGGSPMPSPSFGLFDQVRAVWPASATLRIPETWVSGYYLANLALTSGPGSGRVDRVPFVVRESETRHSQILAQVPVNTWQAYNGWGGQSLYEHSSTGGRRAVAVSFDRPYFIGPGRQEMTDWEIAFVRWLERKGYDVSYQTNIDTHRDPSSLNEHRLVLTLGHDEYWTKEMRDGFEAARAAGTNLGFFGANAAYWQIRYAESERTIISYKSLYDPEPRIELKTALFREVGRPECALLGVQHQGGLQNWGRHDYVVTPAGAADPWAADTGFVEGSRIEDVVSVERDTVPSIGCGTPTVLFRYDAGGDELGDAAAVRYTADSGARIFSAGTMELGWALDAYPARAGEAVPVDARLQKFMENAMDDLTRPAPARSIRATDKGSGVNIEVDAPPDRRVRWDVVRHVGADATPISDPSWRLVCRAAGRFCTDSQPPAGNVRYAAVATDAWGRSLPKVSEPLFIRSAISPRRGVIVVARARHETPAGATYDLFAIDLRRGTVRQLTRSRLSEIDPTWAHDGKRLTFTSTGAISNIPPSPNSRSAVFVADANGANVRRVAAGHDATWSRNGQRIALVRGGIIYIVDVATGRARRLARGTSPSWSKRGLIAFVRGGGAVWVMSPKGGRPRVLLRPDQRPQPDSPLEEPADRAYVDAPAWSPDGRQIVFINRQVSSDGVDRVDERVHVADASGRTRHVYRMDVSRPSWSPDGRWIIGATTEGRICMVALARPRVPTCLRSRGANFDPAWRSGGTLRGVSPDGHGRVRSVADDIGGRARST